MAKNKCNFLENGTSCTEEHDCYINCPEYSNCYNHYKFYMNGIPHTLHQCAELLGISHTTVAAIEKSAISKLKEILQSKKNV